MAVTRVFYYLAPPSHLKKVVGPLLRLLPVSKEVERAVLANIAIIVDEDPVRIEKLSLIRPIVLMKSTVFILL